MSPSELEKTKLVANALDRASTASFTVGIATPLAGLLYNVGNFGASVSIPRMALGLCGWLVAAIALHIMARHVLDGIDR
ncbi:hypothetical protein [Rhizobium sp. 2MFCol3.1]|uniref:hypothetical protein n=1 Tax=Rhizobium sp. 2MFCol3.1 TaxID=1246459 RepID=UPI000364B937|nr:hypothetical protein [Rhizobium sp. 2MFCol3.1]